MQSPPPSTEFCVRSARPNQPAARPGLARCSRPRNQGRTPGRRLEKAQIWAQIELSRAWERQGSNAQNAHPEVDESVMNPLISNASRSLTRCRAPENPGRGVVLCFALRPSGDTRIRRVGRDRPITGETFGGSYRGRKPTYEQARRDRASVHPWHWAEDCPGHYGQG